MRALTPQQQLIAALEHSRSRLMSVIEGLSEEQMSALAIDGWSVKDHLTHLTLWDEMRFFEISRVARGGRASFPETDEGGVAWINDRFAEMRRRLPLAQVLEDMRFAREMVIQAIASSPEQRLDESLFEEIGATGAMHELSHARTIHEWRQREGI